VAAIEVDDGQIAELDILESVDVYADHLFSFGTGTSREAEDPAALAEEPREYALPEPILGELSFSRAELEMTRLGRHHGSAGLRANGAVAPECPTEIDADSEAYGSTVASAFHIA
jgi:hypothetical protein